MLLLFGIVAQSGCGSRDSVDRSASADGSIATKSDAMSDEVLQLAAMAQPLEAEQLSPDELEERVGDLVHQSRFTEAEKLNRSLLLMRPESPTALFLAARIAHGQREMDVAISYLRAIPPDHPEAGLPALGQIADWLQDVGRLEEAESTYREMHSRFGDLVPVHRRLAHLLNAQGRRVEATRHVEALIRLGDVTEKELLSMTTLSVPYHDDEPLSLALVSRTKPNHEALSSKDLARAKQLLVQDEADEAKHLVRQLREVFPDSSNVAAFEGRVYEALQSNEDLEKWFAILPKSIKQEAEYWAAIGQWSLRMKQPTAAIRAFGEAVQIDPTDRVAYLRMAEALAMVGEFEAAERVLERKKWLDEAWQMAMNVGLNRESLRQDLRTLVEQLEKLGRHWEAISWRTILAYEEGRLSEAMPELKHARQRLMQDPPSPPDLLCGIELRRWPLPNSTAMLADAASNLKATKRSSDSLTVSIPVRMVDVAEKLGVNFQFRNHPNTDPSHLRMSQVNGGGIAVVDFDLDGWPDLYFCDAGGPPNDPAGSGANQLFRNLNGRTTHNVSVASGSDDRSYAQGATTADLNQDGFVDLVIANIGVNVICINNGDGTFSPQSIEGSDGWTSSIVCGDLDGDALPEIAEINYIDDETAFETKCWGDGFDCSPRIFAPAKDRFLKRMTNGDWREWPRVGAGLQKANYAFAGIIADFDRKAGNDLFLSNDTTSNHFWVSQASGDGTLELKEQAILRGCASGDNAETQGCMGIAGGDFDRDGSLDLFVTNYYEQPNNLFLQRTPGFFTDMAAPFGLSDGGREMVGFGTQASDLNRDGWLDLIVVNGHVFEPAQNGTPDIPFRMLPQLFRGGPSGFVTQGVFESGDPSVSSSSFWRTPRIARTLVRLDFNRDGRPDLVANSLDAPISILKNCTETQNWLRVDLVGAASERDAVGAEVIAVCGDEQWHAWMMDGTYMGANERTVDFGIGVQEQIDRLQIEWPSGMRQSFENIPANSHCLIVESVNAIHYFEVANHTGEHRGG
ncbi:FG-GAP-like repeat-containing protein [Rhodopirellula bahusiensis]|uniref:FG-GAP-like repeat-containing protein n=5 Tax=Rhodopirellula bahusiensis TaxID=2014065 RepID=UPI003D654D3A